jgi:uncharacterized protein
MPRSANAPFVAAVGLSARMLAHSARRAGLNVAALDIFGDRDTRQHAPLWFDIGGGGLSIDPHRLFDALRRTARLPRMLGFVTSSGLEPLAQELAGGMADELDQLSRLPRFLGNGAEASKAVREPRRFFTLLDELGIAHPETVFTPPVTLDGWLVKRADGCGGTHIHLAHSSQTAQGADGYFQRITPGRSMSALFVGARRAASVIGFAEQLSVTAGSLPFLHAGSIGPVVLPPPVSARITAAIEAVVARTDLTGLNSLDFLLDGDTFQVLEINARPSSTMTLYETASPHAWPRGLIGCHLDACLEGRLPPPHRPAARARAGQRVVFAPRGFVVPQRLSDTCFDDPACHDVPQAGTRIGQGEPVCTLLVTGASVAAVRGELERREALLLQRIETCHEDPDDVFPSSS